MACIGDKIDAHLLGSLRSAAVGEVHHFLAWSDRLDPHIPHLALLADAGQANRMPGMLGVGVGEALDRTGMAECDAHILADNIDTQ